MRLKFWQRRTWKKAVEERLDYINISQIKQTMDTREWLGGELDRIREGITAIHPAHIDMTQELADAILEKTRSPLAITQETSDWLKEVAGGYPFQWTTPLGYSHNAGMIQAQITAMGTVIIELKNHQGETVWRGEFAPPNDAE